MSALAASHNVSGVKERSDGTWRQLSQNWNYCLSLNVLGDIWVAEAGFPSKVYTFKKSVVDSGVAYMPDVYACTALGFDTCKTIAEFMFKKRI